MIDTSVCHPGNSSRGTILATHRPQGCPNIRKLDTAYAPDVHPDWSVSFPSGHSPPVATHTPKRCYRPAPKTACPGALRQGSCHRHPPHRQVLGNRRRLWAPELRKHLAVLQPLSHPFAPAHQSAQLAPERPGGRTALELPPRRSPPPVREPPRTWHCWGPPQEQHS